MNTTTLTQPASNAAMALLSISGVRLMLPQREIRALESLADVAMQDAELPAVGGIQHAQQRWPVYCLSPELTLQAAVPAERRACVLLETGTGYMGILCDDVSIARRVPDRQHELPSAMRVPDTPVLGLAVLDEQEIVCVTSAERLVAHLTRQVGM
ncbi:MAG: chemotaxis protein CheW [Nitrosomonadales bacterium]|nr:chemotaxis protein CheW [Nitrosomonadales bacterium]